FTITGTVTEPGTLTNQVFYEPENPIEELGWGYASATSYLDYPEIQISQIKGPVGTPVTIQGGSFTPSSIIQIDFGTHQTITTAISNTNGTFSVTFLVNTQPYGSQLIKLLDTIHYTLNTIHFFILPQITQISPQSAHIGDSISISGNGFSGNEIVYFYVTGSTFGCLADQNGAFSSQFLINTQQGGTKVVTAQSYYSGAMATSSFVVLLQPQITLVSPTEGPVGTVVTVEGSGISDQGLVR
ncbi:MAG: hypothetical protein QME07_07840, partial [bacterium]|nr:hypothetical protein [bacterium]